ncbi:molybdenum cofactor guanylyltransferase [Lentibacillus amyloliquefaciens]|uniref:Probable molybdenum cofactor guanylyltransferase n=1 Tax=Lentibacillus amyloliquefaciens TaxID=1472767 RepID=A0A0U4E3R0_9BACI|nr:molybdenum cofactor guanylyltransferase [Lentibacillus amyloliquefaciens]ALX47916.1 molybdopterin-guanine dinucleotide biosynthesis protein A [Lentibacillus amyloliquefaciens]
MHISGVILAGGKSSRMGKTKSLLNINGKPAIAHIADEVKNFCDDTAVIANEPASYHFLGLNLYRDRYEDKGPLAGIETAIYHIDADVYVLAACDMPFIDKAIFQHLIQSLGNAEAVIPIYNERMHPLSGIYTKDVLPHIQKLLDNDERKIRTLFKAITVNYVADFNDISEEVLDKHFFNMNYPEQYEMTKQFKKA